MNNILIGINAGADLTDESNVVIIGDNVRSLDQNQENVMFIGNRMALGKTVNGRKHNLFEIIEDYEKPN